MDWKFGSTATDWIFSSTNFELAAGSFTIESAPTEIRRGGSYSIVCTNVTEEPSAATLDGQPIAVNGYSATGIDFTVPLNTLAGHGVGKVLSFTVAGVVQTVTLTFSQDVGRLYTVLTSYSPGEMDVFAGMTDLDTGLPMTPEAGGQVVYDDQAGPYPVIFLPDGSVEFDTDGAELNGTETFQFQYLLPGVAISNVVTITAADYIEANSDPILAAVIPDQSVAEGAAISFSIASYFSDANNDPLTFSKVSGDVAISVSSAGLVTGAINTAGTYPITVQADDGNGGTPATDTFNIVVTEVVNTVFRPAHPLEYFNAQGQIVPLASVSNIPWVAFGPGGVVSGERLASGVLSTDASGNFADIDSDLLGNVGDAIQIVILPPSRALVISGNVIDGDA